MNYLKGLLALSAVLALTACPKPADIEDDNMNSTVETSTADSIDGSTAGYNGDNGGSAYVDGNPLVNGRDTLVFYFDFDQSTLRSEYSNAVQAHAQYLNDNPNVNVRLEGHADERGSREYNIGLGEKRAQAVRRALMLQGVAAGQLSTRSFGEEKPVAMGSNEAAWSQNRRVEIIY